VEVVGTDFNERKHNMEEFAFQKWDINMIEDTNTGIVVDCKSVEVVGTVINVKNIVIEGYMMQKKEELNMIEDTNGGDMVIFKVGKTVVIKREYNTAERQKKLTVMKGDTDIDLFEDIHMENVIIAKSVKVVKKVKKVMIINMMEYNTAEMHEKLTVKKRDININMFEDINMGDVNIVKFVVMVKVVFYIMLEGTNMRDRVIKMVYGTAEMKKRITVKEMKNTKKREDFWSFRDIETRQDSVLSWMGKELVEFVARRRLHLGRTAV
jgi:hypothetical protein